MSLLFNPVLVGPVSHNDDVHNTTAKRNVPSGIAGLDSNGLLSINQLPKGVINSYSISNGVLDSNDPEQNTTFEGGTEFGLFIFNSLKPSPATIRLQFKLKTNNPVLPAYASIIKNSEVQSTDICDVDTDYHTFMHDIEISEDDIIVLEFKTTFGGTAFAKDFRILGTVTPFDANLGWNIISL